MICSVMASLVHVFEKHYAGQDGELLLQVAHAIWDKRINIARQLIMNEVIVANATANGGKNKLSEMLMLEANAI